MLPILFESSWLVLYSYPLLMGMAWGAAYYLTVFLLQEYQVKVRLFPLLFGGIFISAWMGAKVFFLMFSAKEKAMNYLYADKFWLGGGFVFYGGLIFGFGFYLLYSFVLKGIKFKDGIYLLPGLIFGHAIGRIGCFLAGCCYGVQTKVPWSIFMHNEHRHPTQIYEAIGLLIMGAMTLNFIKHKRIHFFIISFYFISYALLRFFLEFYRGDKIRGILFFHLSTSQWISLGIAFLLFLLQLFQYKNSKHN